MVIPHQFSLMAHTWTVEHVQGRVIADDGDECNGLCIFDKLTIKVNVTLPPTLVVHTYLHELMHATLWSLGNKLCDDEAFVDSISNALTQAIQSGEQNLQNASDAV